MLHILMFSGTTHPEYCRAKGSTPATMHFDAEDQVSKVNPNILKLLQSAEWRLTQTTGTNKGTVHAISSTSGGKNPVARVCPIVTDAKEGLKPQRTGNGKCRMPGFVVGDIDTSSPHFTVELDPSGWGAGEEFELSYLVTNDTLQKSQLTLSQLEELQSQQTHILLLREEQLRILLRDNTLFHFMCLNPADGFNFEAVPGTKENPTKENPLMIFATDLTEVRIDHTSGCAGGVELRSTFRLKAYEYAAPDSQPVNGALPVTLGSRVVAQAGEQGVQLYSEHPKKTEELFPRDSLVLFNLQIAVRSENAATRYVLQKETSCPVCLRPFDQAGLESTRWDACQHEICTECKQLCTAECEKQQRPVQCPVCRREQFPREQGLHTGLYFEEEEREQSLQVQTFETRFQNLLQQGKHDDMYTLFQEADHFVQEYARSKMWQYMVNVLYETRKNARKRKFA
jgi:hypothetical protein